MGNYEFEMLAKFFVWNHYNVNNSPVPIDEVYVVWLCKTLGNNKALLSTTVNDDMYFEVTYNGEKQEFYFDAYKKQQNFCIPLGDLNLTGVFHDHQSD